MHVIEPFCRNNQKIAENFLGRCPTTTWSFITATVDNRADYVLHVCMGVLCLSLESKLIGTDEIPEPQNHLCTFSNGEYTLNFYAYGI